MRARPHVRGVEWGAYTQVDPRVVASLLHAHAGHMEHTVEALLALAETTPPPPPAVASAPQPPSRVQQHAELATSSGAAARGLGAAVGSERTADGAGQTEAQVGAHTCTAS